jgi:hypothetical protein
VTFPQILSPGPHPSSVIRSCASSRIGSVGEDIILSRFQHDLLNRNAQLVSTRLSHLRVKTLADLYPTGGDGYSGVSTENRQDGIGDVVEAQRKECDHGTDASLAPAVVLEAVAKGILGNKYSSWSRPQSEFKVPKGRFRFKM